MKRTHESTTWTSRCGAVIVLLGAITVAQGGQPKTEPRDADAAFARLTSLAGEWQGVEFGIDVVVTYTLIGNGSTLMEETRPVKGPDIQAMTTMFSVDGNHLLATHYCDAENQPQMASAPVMDPNMNSFSFSLVRITGMKTPGDWHNTALEISLDDKDHQTQKWRYVHDGKTGTNVFHLTRKPM